jgi:small-conductance mechanosensitive channel
MNALDSWQRLLSELTPRGALIEIGVLLACLLAAYLLVRAARGRSPQADSIWYGARTVDGVLFPLVALLIELAARWALGGLMQIALLKLATPVLASLLVIRLSVRVLHMAFPNSPLVRRLERTVSWVVWAVLVLWLSGVLPMIVDELDSVHWRVAGVEVSVTTLIQGALSAGAVLLLALWLSATLEARLLKGVTGSDISARKIAANATRALLMLVGLLLALSVAGIPLSALSVLGGALGVGVGLGLQKLAANYVSGFVILAERSLRIGDLVKVDNFEGHVTDIKTRYTVIRAPNGRESIVPNEMLVTQRIENSSLADPSVLLSTVVQVAYGSDLNSLMPQLATTVRAVPRVLSNPSPVVLLTAFAADGLELTLHFWIGDPEKGQASVRSAVNLAVLAALNAAGVQIPFPQRVLRSAAVPLPLPVPGAGSGPGAAPP